MQTYICQPPLSHIELSFYILYEKQCNKSVGFMHEIKIDKLLLLKE